MFWNKVNIAGVLLLAAIILGGVGGRTVQMFAAQERQTQQGGDKTGQEKSSATGQKTKDPLVELNSRFRAAYAQARKELLAQQGPIIIADGDSVILLRRGQRTEVNVTGQADIVKPIAHTPLAVHVLLASAGEGELAEERLMALRGIRDLIDQADKSLVGRGLPEDIRLVQTQILLLFLPTLGNCQYGPLIPRADLAKFYPVDLQACANQKRTDDLHESTIPLLGNNLAELASGKHQLLGIQFQVGTCFLQLGSTLLKQKMPTKIEIKVRRKFTALHVLHATAYGVDEDQVTIGSCGPKAFSSSFVCLRANSNRRSPPGA